MNVMMSNMYVGPAPIPVRRASMGTRKRSLSGGIGLPSSGNSLPMRRSESDREMAPLVPVGVAFMEQVALSITVTKHNTDVRYVMTVHHLKTNSTWRHARSFDEYRSLQQRLLKAINHGHFCSAECPWLFMFLKSYFPKRNLFQFSSTRLIATRKDALHRFFVTLQSFLSNRGNHGCSYVANAFVNELVTFVYGDHVQSYELEAANNDNQRPSLQARNSFTTKPSLRHVESLSSTCDDDEESPLSNSSMHCLLCDSSLEGEAHAGRVSLMMSSSLPMHPEDDIMRMSDPTIPGGISASWSAGSLLSTSTSTSSGRRNTKYYVTTLGCGHQFHDECIVPILNQTLRCPTCDHLEVK
ncbi:hypothetical protein Poli38472_007288 [Pythium oligandrum]|uniref:RING-type domain-containing protein n=1 Tax=Pythium oligandrum TaxID=41045 RepID=A0A8K1FHV7_PYTOL|nr:hypothetical protein Poli38472_007288 [Pythium oligandrum]|eukprot:TMW59143.1 hypothetical protein Poli38472_007288 [Pythium oligandrum]